MPRGVSAGMAVFTGGVDHLSPLDRPKLNENPG